MPNPLEIFGIPHWAWDTLIMVFIFLLILIAISIGDILSNRGILPRFISRNIFQIFAGPIFLVCWVLYAGNYYSRYFAAAVPSLYFFIFLVTGLGLMKNEKIVRIMSRKDQATELLTSPLFYTIVMAFAALFLWYVLIDLAGVPNYSILIPTAFLVFGPLAGGDSFADIIGQRYGKYKFKVFGEKSIEGSLAMFIFGLLFTFGLLGIYWIIFNPIYQSINLLNLLLPIIVVCVVATIVEIISPRHFDNLLIPISALITLLTLSWLGLYPYYLLWPFRPPI